MVPAARSRRNGRPAIPPLGPPALGYPAGRIRSHMLCRDVALSCCGAGYGNQDSTLVVDLPGSRLQPRCYFIADGRGDPYGKTKIETGSARHLKALHLQPFWAGTQRGGDALGLVVYRAKDIASPDVSRVQSHFVVRRPDAIWLEGRPLIMPKGTAAKPAEVRIADGHLVLRYGSAAVGVCARSFCWQDSDNAKLVDDGNDLNCLRLTIDHGPCSDLTKDSSDAVVAGAAFWVRIGSGLRRDTDFEAWRRKFEKDLLGTGWEESTERFTVSLLDSPEKKATLLIDAVAPGSPAARVQLMPKPFQGVLEVDGVEIGRPLLAAVEPLVSHEPGAGPLRCMTVPAGKALFWEAETGLVLPGMTVGSDSQASGQQWVGQESSPIGQPSGSVVWSLKIEEPRRYWLWARVRSADARRGAFAVQMIGEEGAAMPVANWVPRPPRDWLWQRLEFEGTKSSTVLDLTKGVFLLNMQTRQSGTLIDRLMLTADPNERP